MELADEVDAAGELMVLEGDYFGSGKLGEVGENGPVLVEYRWASK